MISDQNEWSIFFFEDCCDFFLLFSFAPCLDQFDRL